jgi:hypothetical protein
MVEQLKTGRAFEVMTNGFWSPRLQELTVQFARSDDLEGNQRRTLGAPARP